MASDSSPVTVDSLSDKIKRQVRINELRTERGMDPIPEQPEQLEPIDSSLEDDIGMLLAQHEDLSLDLAVMIRVQNHLRDLMDLMRQPSISSSEKKRQYDILLHLVADYDGVVESTSHALSDLETQIDEQSPVDE